MVEGVEHHIGVRAFPSLQQARSTSAPCHHAAMTVWDPSWMKTAHPLGKYSDAVLVVDL